MSYFNRTASASGQLEANRRIQDWTRARFRLDPDAAVMVAELACTLPNCPPLETVVAFWDDQAARHQFRLLLPMTEVSRADIGWLIGSLTDHEGGGWDCC